MNDADGKPAEIIEFEAEGRSGVKSTRVKNQIATHALHLFAEDGFHGASTRAIARRAGVTQSLLLYHFESKEKLWFFVMEGMIKRHRAATAASMPLQPQAAPQESLKALIDVLIEFSTDFPQFHRIMTMEGTQNSQRLTWLIEHQLQPHYRMVIDLIERGQKLGQVRSGDPLRLYYGIIGVCGMLATARPEIERIAGRDLSTRAERRRSKAFLHDLLFNDRP